jgi:hypothetical protein
LLAARNSTLKTTGGALENKRGADNAKACKTSQSVGNKTTKKQGEGKDKGQGQGGEGGKTS